MKSHPLGYKGTRSVCVALVNNKNVESIDFEDNDIGTDGAVCLADMLKENESINEVVSIICTSVANQFTPLMKSLNYYD